MKVDLETKRQQWGSLPQKWTQSTGGPQNSELVNAVLHSEKPLRFQSSLSSTPYKLTLFLASGFFSLLELSTGLLTFSQFGQKDNADPKVCLLSLLSFKWLRIVQGFILSKFRYLHCLKNESSPLCCSQTGSDVANDC